MNNNKNLNDLPASNEKEFWGEDSEHYNSELPINKKKYTNEHHLVWQGYEAVCISCPNPHTVELDPSKFDLVDGKIIKKAPKYFLQNGVEKKLS